jgi:N-acetylmuramic acid 6-phosphate etherase
MHRLAHVEAVSDNSGLGDLATESWDPAGADLDLRSTDELVALMGAADATVPAAVALAHDAVVQAIDGVAARLEAGGRLIYVGAGTSGRLALADALECRATFALAPAASSRAAPTRPSPKSTVADLVELGLAEADAVVAISASGRTPYVLGALDEARCLGALTVAIVCVEGSPLGAIADHGSRWSSAPRGSRDRRGSRRAPRRSSCSTPSRRSR